MTTYIDFVPSTVQPFSFSPTLDGQQYSATITWNLFGARFYLNLYALDGTLIISRALVGSAIGFQIATLSWLNGTVTLTTSVPHGYKLGRVISLTLSGATPNAYNGLFEMLVTGPSTLTFALSSNPGAATVTGTLSYNVNLVGGVPNELGNYFASTLVFRTANQQFETNP